MKLSRTVIYAINAILELAQSEPGRPVPCSRIAERGGMPERFLLHIMRNLVKHGVVCSVRGVDGGYCLSRMPDKISVLEIMNAFGDPLNPTIAEYQGLAPKVRNKLLIALEQSAATTRANLEKLMMADLL